MQDKYAGDVGDFGKYFLLNKLHLFGKGGFRLGINWYLCSMAEPGSNDGRHLSYLSPGNKRHAEYLNCDPSLHGKLSSLINSGARSVSGIENGSILPAKTLFYSDPMPVKTGRDDNYPLERKKWFGRSAGKLAPADIIFLDPDNGIAPSSLSEEARRAIKYAFMDEIENYYDAGKSVIVYNHRDRSPKVVYLRRLAGAGRKICGIRSFRVFRFRRVSVRDYLVFSQSKHEDIFGAFSTMIKKDPHNFLFDNLL